MCVCVCVSEIIYNKQFSRYYTILGMSSHL